MQFRSILIVRHVWFYELLTITYNKVENMVPEILAIKRNNKSIHGFA